MVGGYVIFANKVFTIGEHDLVEYFGSFEAAESYANAVINSGKPVLVSCKIPTGVATGWLEATATAGMYKFAGIASFIFVIDTDARTFKVQVLVD